MIRVLRSSQRDSVAVFVSGSLSLSHKDRMPRAPHEDCSRSRLQPTLQMTARHTRYAPLCPRRPLLTASRNSQRSMLRRGRNRQRMPFFVRYGDCSKTTRRLLDDCAMEVVTLTSDFASNLHDRGIRARRPCPPFSHSIAFWQLGLAPRIERSHFGSFCSLSAFSHAAVLAYGRILAAFALSPWSAICSSILPLLPHPL